MTHLRVLRPPEPAIGPVPAALQVSSAIANGSQRQQHQQRKKGSATKPATETRRATRTITTRTPPDHYTAEENTVLWDAYLAQAGSDIPAPRRATVRWVPAPDFLSTLAARLQKSQDSVTKRMRILLQQYQWSKGRFAVRDLFANSGEVPASGQVDESVSLGSVVGDVSVPDTGELLGGDKDATITAPVSVGPTAAPAQASPAVPVDITTAIASRTRLRTPSLSAVEAIAVGAGSDTDSDWHAPVPKLRRYTPDEDDVIWAAYQQVKRAQPIRLNQLPQAIRRVAKQLGRTEGAVTTRLNKLRCTRTLDHAPPAKDEEAAAADENEVDYATLLDRFVIPAPTQATASCLHRNSGDCAEDKSDGVTRGRGGRSLSPACVEDTDEDGISTTLPRLSRASISNTNAAPSLIITGSTSNSAHSPQVDDAEHDGDASELSSLSDAESALDADSGSHIDLDGPVCNLVPPVLSHTLAPVVDFMVEEDTLLVQVVCAVALGGDVTHAWAALAPLLQHEQRGRLQGVLRERARELLEDALQRMFE